VLSQKSKKWDNKLNDQVLDLLLTKFYHFQSLVTNCAVKGGHYLGFVLFWDITQCGVVILYWGNLSVPSSRVRKAKKSDNEDRTDGLDRNVGTELPLCTL
jgi:hypothetical protein